MDKAMRVGGCSVHYASVELKHDVSSRSIHCWWRFQRMTLQQNKIMEVERG